MAQRTKFEIDRDILLARMPPEATRVQVRDEFGKLKYRARHEIAPGDEVQVDKNGDPVVMIGKPGRRAFGGDPPLVPATPAIAKLIRLKDRAVDDDPILAVARRDPESPDVLHQAILALGEEAARIGHDRIEAERRGEETSNISTRRINALKTLVDTWLKRKDQLTAKEIDLNSPAFRALFSFIMEIFRDAMEVSGLRSEEIETVFARVAKIIENDQWANDAKNRMKNAK